MYLATLSLHNFSSHVFVIFCTKFCGFLGFVILKIEFGYVSKLVFFFPQLYVVHRPSTKMWQKMAFVGNAQMVLPLVYKSNPCPIRLRK